MATTFYISMGYNFSCMIASDTLFDSRGGFSGYSCKWTLTGDNDMRLSYKKRFAFSQPICLLVALSGFVLAAMEIAPGATVRLEIDTLIVNILFKIFHDCRYVPCDEVVGWCHMANFLRPVFSTSRVQHVSDLHPKFALRPHHV